MNTAFQAWHTEQKAKGLVDIKFAVLAGKGVSVEAIQNEILTAEALIAQGVLRSPPQATSMMPDEVSDFIKALN